MKRIIRVIRISVILAMTITPAVSASDVSGAVYYGTVRATNNSTEADNVAAAFTANTSSWIDSGILNATATNVAILNNAGADTSFMPGYGSNPWIVFFASVPANGNIDATIYASDTVTGGQIRIFLNDTGMSVDDSANLEHGANFSDTFKGYFLNSDTFAYKTGVLEYLYDAATENITAQIYSGNTTQTISPSAPGDESSTGLVGAATRWQAQSDSNDGTYVYSPSESYVRDFYESGNLSFTQGSISSVQFNFRIQGGINSLNVYAKPEFKIDGVIYTGTEQSQAEGAAATKTQTYTTNPATGQAWTISEINNLQMGISLKTGQAPFEGRCLGIWLIVDYFPVAASVSATGVTSGEHEIMIQMSTQTGSVTLYPNGQGFYSQVPLRSPGSAPDYTYVDEITSDNDTTFIYTAGNTTEVKDSFTLEDVPSWLSSVQVDNVTATFVITSYGNYYTGRRQGLRLNSVDVLGSQVWGSNLPWPAWFTFSNTLSRPGGGAWSVSDINNLEVITGLQNNTSNPAENIRLTQQYVTVNYSYNLLIFINGVEQQEERVFSPSVPDNTNPYVLAPNNVMPYVESIEMVVGGTQMGYWEWEFGENLTDQSGHGNTATPGYRTTSSDTDVSASLISFQPVEVATVENPEELTWPSLGDTPPEEPETAFSSEERPGIFFEPLVHVLWALTGLPDSFFWYNWAFSIILGASILTYFFFAKNNQAALFVKIVVTATIMVFFALPGLNIYGLFVPIYYCFFGFGILVLSKSYGW